MCKPRPPEVFYGPHPKSLGAGCVVALAGEMPWRERGEGVLVKMLTVYPSMNIFTLYLNSDYIYINYVPSNGHPIHTVYIEG